MERVRRGRRDQIHGKVGGKGVWTRHAEAEGAEAEEGVASATEEARGHEDRGSTSMVHVDKAAGGHNDLGAGGGGDGGGRRARSARGLPGDVGGEVVGGVRGVRGGPIAAQGTAGNLNPLVGGVEAKELQIEAMLEDMRPKGESIGVRSLKEDISNPKRRRVVAKEHAEGGAVVREGGGVEARRR